MGRFTRNCRAANLDAENIPLKAVEKRNRNVKQTTNVPTKSILGDRTNLRETGKNIKSPQVFTNRNTSKKCEENNLKIDTKCRKITAKGMSNVPLKSKLNLKSVKDDEEQSDSFVVLKENINTTNFENTNKNRTDSLSCSKAPVEPTNLCKVNVKNLQSSINKKIETGTNRILREKRNTSDYIKKGKEGKTPLNSNTNNMSNNTTKNHLRSVGDLSDNNEKNFTRILREKNNGSLNENQCPENDKGLDRSIHDLSFKVSPNGALKLVTNYRDVVEEPLNESSKPQRAVRNCSSVYSRKGKEKENIDTSKTNYLLKSSPILEIAKVNDEKQSENNRPLIEKKIYTPRISDKKQSHCTKRRFLNTNSHKLPKLTEEKDSDSESFLGFEDEEIDPFLIHLIKQVKLSRPNHLPVYKSISSSPNKRPLEKKEDILNLYEFEVDENEPVIKKGKRKPILKMGSKMFRTYKKKKKEVALLSPLNLSDQGNTRKKNKPVKAKKNTNKCNYSKASENTSFSSCAPSSHVGSTSFANELETSIEDAISVRSEMIYSPKPYESPKRDSISVPILRSSIPPSSESPRSLNMSACSNKCNSVINSPFSSHFGTPAYIGSSTPINNHWAEQTNNVYSNINDWSVKNYDVSNCFGFDDSLIEEPFVSPIKMYTPGKTPNRVTPGKTPNRVTPGKTPNRVTPKKLSHQEVRRMLKYGPDAKDLPPEESDSPSKVEELLPDNFFHDGNTPTYDYSPGKSPSYPFDLKKKKTTNKGHKKKAVKFDETGLKDETHQSVIDKTHNETDIGENKTVGSNNRTLRAHSRMLRKNNQTLPTISETQEEISRIEECDPKDFDISSFEQVAKKPRRSYERPGYLRVKKYDDDVHSDVEDDPEPVQESTYITPTKTPAKKKNELSKKEKIELEKWAKAFNEQCMAVESFNLVVE